MIVQRKHFLYFIIIGLSIKPNDGQLSLLQNLLKLGDTARNTDLAKFMINSLPIPKNIRKFTDQKVLASAIKEFQAGTKDEDKDLNITQLITKNGYPVETIEVVTEDGYRLEMFRIPNNGPPVLFVHGILSSPDDWITSGINIALPYLMSNKGYDVYMGCARGSKYSKKHVTLDPVKDKKQFWHFSWDEIGRYDLPAMIDYILDKTGQEQLIYVGHSQGCTTFFVLCSERPEYNDKIKYMVALAPPVFMKHTPSPILQLLARFAYYEDDILVKLIGPQLFSDDIEAVFKSLLCDGVTNIVTAQICISALFLIAGFNYEQANYERLPTILKHFVSGSSANQAVHFAQCIEHGEFLRFDFRKSKNLQKYGSKTPPEYPLENFRVPLAIFHGNNDWLNDIRDVRKLMGRLTNSNYTFHEVRDELFAHLDFLFGKDAKELVYDKVISLIEENWPL